MFVFTFAVSGAPPRTGAAVTPPPPRRSRTFATISSILRSSNSPGPPIAISPLILHVPRFAVDRDLVDDRHDRRIDGTVLSDLRLARGRSRGIQHDLAEAGPHGIDRHCDRSGGVAVDVAGPHDEELEPLERRFL